MTSVPDTSAQFGMEQDPDEVVKPKSLARTKLLQPCVLREAGMEEYEGQDMDLKVEVTDREMVGVKSDAYITYKICTQVRGERPGRKGSGWEGKMGEGG